MRLLMVALGVCLALSVVAALPYPVWLYGMHDTGGESHMIDKGTPGWVVIAVAIGHDPNDHSGGDYTSLSNQGLGVIVRLNNGWNPDGTIPYQKHYNDFAQRCANYVAASPGCRIWIIGNEPNLSVERPSYEGYEEVIYPDMYAQCYTLCRNAIKSVPGHEDDIVVTAAPGNWNVETGDWLDYFENMLNYIGAGNLDGIAVHTYTHGTDPNLIFSNEKGGNNWYWHFRSYIDVMNRIPQSMRDLPVYITETDQCEPWADTNSGWVKNAYYEINSWNNTSGNQKIHALCLYRWQTYDSYYITGKWGVINDWRDAMDYQYRWDTAGGGQIEGENLSLKAATYLECGHNLEEQRGKYALDGNTSTKWCCLHNGLYNSGDHILTLDLGSTCQVSGYIVKHASTGGEGTYLNTKEFYIETAASMQGPWTVDFHVINSNQESSNTLTYSTLKDVRYVRLRVVKPNYDADWAVRLPEFEVWGYAGSRESVKFEAEDYDGGANAVSGTDYYDTTSGNTGGQYRSQDVDIENCAEGGYNVGWIANGEWLAFPFYGGDTYYATIRYAGISTGYCHLEIDGQDVTGTITLPATGGWQSWTSVDTGTFTISEGHHTLKLVMDSSGFNVNYFTLVPSEPQVEENLALKAATYLECGHNLEEQKGKYALDGNTSTKWCCLHNGLYNGGDHILTLDLGSTCQITKFVVKHASTGGEATYLNTKEFYIESGNSLQGPWSEEFHVVNYNQESSNTLTYSSPKSLRYVRLRVVVPNYNADWAVRLPEFEVWGYVGSPESVKFEAEDYDGGANAVSGTDYYDTTSGNTGGQYRSQDVDIETCSEGGYNVGWIDNGEWLAFPFYSRGGTYTLSIRHAGISTGYCHLEIDGQDVTGTITLPATGAWQSWTTTTTGSFSVSEGRHTIKLVMDSSGFNVNYFTLIPQ